MKDLYKILGISKSCNENDIKKAYKKLAFQYHPDKNNSSGAEDKFREIVRSINIKSYNYDGVFIDIGMPEDYLKLINEKNNEK